MKVYRFLSIAALALFGISCAKEPVFESAIDDPDLIPLNIASSINQVPTRATADGFVNGDAVGLYAVNYLENNTVAGTLAVEGNQADNVKYVFDEQNYKWVPVKGVYYKDINTHVDLYLYYPYEGTISNVTAANFEVKKDQSTAATATELSGYEASDWMWGKATDITPSQSSVRIPLSHKMSAIKVTLNEGTGWDTDEFSAVSKGVIVTNTTRKATLNYATGDVTPVGNPQLEGIVMCPQTDGTFRAVVIPQTVAAGTSLFSITVNGISYSFMQNDPVTYQQGKMLNVTININKKTPTGDHTLELAGAQIVDWTEDFNTHGGEARQYFVVNVETPGTLGATIEAMQKNPAKIRNLKVTGTVNADDFYFMRDNMDILEAVNMKESKVVNVVVESGHHYNEVGESCWDTEYAEDAIPESAFQEKQTLIHFVFPEVVTKIGQRAFCNTTLSGLLVLPSSVVKICGEAFSYTNISGIQLSSSLKTIGSYAFMDCHSVSGDLLIPSSVTSIGYSAFVRCKGFSGRLSLPNSIEFLGGEAFMDAGNFIGDLIIPERIQKVPSSAFSGSTFTGNLILSNVTEFGTCSFWSCQFSGALNIPEGVQEIPGSCFGYNRFNEIHFPSSLRMIRDNAFYVNTAITEPIVFPEGLITIEDWAFFYSSIPSIVLPSTLQTIGRNAFNNDFNISSIVCDAVEPPSVLSGAFDGVAKDNFTVGVPSQSVKRYQAESGWADFKRIAAHYDFSLSRNHLRALNGSKSQTFILRAPANYSWSIDNKPEWVTVEPASGTGKTDVTITVAEMPRTNDTFEVNEGTFTSPSYKQFKGRCGDVVFILDDKNYTFSLNVEQYDYDYPDGNVYSLQSATQGAGIDIVFTGDGYDARDIAKGAFIDNAVAGYEHLFNIEPYKSYKDYFNVYAVTALSDESGIGTLNTIIDTKFGSTLTQSRILLQSPDDVFAWAKKAHSNMVLSKSLVILLQNTSVYEGITYMYADGSAIACCPVSTQDYPYDFRGIIQHEAGGHGFGKLGDEYIYHNAFIMNCPCICCEHPQGDDDMSTSYGVMKSLGWFKNLSMTSDAKRVPWAHLIYNPQYSDYVDMYEGGYMHTRGMYRSEATSCMNNNIPYFSAISRQAIVERIKYCAGETFSLEDFYANDNDDFGPTRVGGKYAIDRTFGVDPHLNHATGHGPVLVGDHPNVK